MDFDNKRLTLECFWLLKDLYADDRIRKFPPVVRDRILNLMNELEAYIDAHGRTEALPRDNT